MRISLYAASKAKGYMRFILKVRSDGRYKEQNINTVSKKYLLYYLHKFTCYFST